MRPSVQARPKTAVAVRALRKFDPRASGFTFSMLPTSIAIHRLKTIELSDLILSYGTVFVYSNSSKRQPYAQESQAADAGPLAQSRRTQDASSCSRHESNDSSKQGHHTERHARQ